MALDVGAARLGHGFLHLGAAHGARGFLRRAARRRGDLALQVGHFHIGAVAQTVSAVHHHRVAGGQAGQDLHLVAILDADAHVALGDGLVGPHQEDIGAVGAALHGGHGHGRLVFQRVDQQADIHELGREQPAVLVVEHRAQLDRAGRRIDHRVHRRQHARSNLVGLAAVKNLDRQHRAGVHPLQHRADIVFGDREQHRHGIELRHHHDAVGLARRHDVADIDQMDAGTAIHRRHDVGVAQVDARGLHIGLVGNHDAFGRLDQRFLRRHLLRGNRILRLQRLVAFQVDLGVGERRGIARQLAAHLIQRRLIGARIDLGQHIAGLDHLAFGEIDLHQHAAHLRAHGGGGQRRHGAQRVQRDVDVARHHARHADRLRALVHHAASAVALGRIDRPDQKRQQTKTDRKPHHARQARIGARPALHAFPGTAHAAFAGSIGAAKFITRAVDVHHRLLPSQSKGPEPNNDSICRMG